MAIQYNRDTLVIDMNLKEQRFSLIFFEANKRSQGQILSAGSMSPILQSGLASVAIQPASPDQVEFPYKEGQVLQLRTKLEQLGVHVVQR